MNTIQVNIDFSEAAKNAFEYSLHIARTFHSRMVLFHVCHLPIIEPYMPTSMQAELLKQQQDQALTYFDKLENQRQDSLSENIEIIHRVALGNPWMKY